MFFPLLMSLLVLQIFPTKIPTHYGLSGNVDRWGIKYTVLILPIWIIILGCFFTFLIKRTNSKSKETQLLTAGLLSLTTFNILNIYILTSSYKRIANLSAMPIDIFNLSFILIGFSYLFLGNIFAEMNAALINSTSSRIEPISKIKSKLMIVSRYRLCGFGFIFLGLFTNFSNIVYLLIFGFVSIILLLFKIIKY